jgi:hypothetical protein
MLIEKPAVAVLDNNDQFALFCDGSENGDAVPRVALHAAPFALLLSKEHSELLEQTQKDFDGLKQILDASDWTDRVQSKAGIGVFRSTTELWNRRVKFFRSCGVDKHPEVLAAERDLDILLSSIPIEAQMKILYPGTK